MGAYEVVESEGAKIVKLFPAGTPRKEAEDELRYAHLAMDLRIPVPFMHEVVDRDGRPGILMDKVIGPDYLEWMLRTPLAWQKLSRYFAFLQHELHKKRIQELPSLNEKLEARIAVANLPEEMRTLALGALKALPVGDMLCNGNFSPFTVIVSLDGPRIMDWSEAAKGYYLGDVARTCLLIELSSVGAEEKGLNSSQVNMLEKLRAAYVYEFMKIGCIDEKELNQWMAPVAAARIAEEVPGERDILLSIVQRHLH